MSKLINGKEALIALANGEDVQASVNGFDWREPTDFGLVYFLNDDAKFRLKPRTISINGIEVPAPFKPEDGDKYYHISVQSLLGYGWDEWESSNYDARASVFGAWQTEEEIKQVVAALRCVFGGES